MPVQSVKGFQQTNSTTEKKTFSTVMRVDCVCACI